MQKNIVLQNLQNPADLQKLRDYLRDLYREIDPIYTEDDPDGNVTARRGRQALYFDGVDYFLCVNIDGKNSWKKTVALV